MDSSMLALQLGGVVHHSIPGLFLGVMGRTDYVTGNPVCGLGSTEKVHHVSISWHSIRSPKLIWWNIHLALSRIKVLASSSWVASLPGDSYSYVTRRVKYTKWTRGEAAESSALLPGCTVATWLSRCSRSITRRVRSSEQAYRPVMAPLLSIRYGIHLQHL